MMRIEVVTRTNQIGFARSKKCSLRAKLALLVQKNMATIQQIDANRLNALKSTGPRTPEGKAAVSLNPLRHGLRARTLILPNESPADFTALCEDVEAEWQPQSRTEQFYLEQMAISQWKLSRMEAAERDVCERSLPAAQQVLLLDRIWQAQGRMERAYARAHRELARLHKSRPDQPQPPTPITDALAS
jgi:hypothetical protein